MLTESCYSQNEGNHDGDPGHPESLLPVVLGLMGLQAHAALQETCGEKHKSTYKNSSAFLFVSVLDNTF